MKEFKEYDADNIYFAYPENWILEENEMETATGSIQLSHTDGAFWLLKKYPFGANPDEIIEEVLGTMKSEYRDMESDRIDKVLFEKRIFGYEITFFYLDLMNLATVLCFEQDGQTLAVFWQTGNQLIIQADEAVPPEMVLEAITYSLIRGKVS